jgi:putative ABC transport system permease protein
MLSQRTLWLTGWRYLLRRPWQSLLMALGVTLGVAVVIAVDLANASASRAFDLSAETVAGRATHQITGGPQGLDEAVYTRLRRAGIPVPSAPALVEYVASPQLGDTPLQLLGVDPFAEAPFRSYLASDIFGRAPQGDLIAFLTQPGAILISEELAQRYGLAVAQSITLEIAGEFTQVFIAGILQPSDSLSQRALQGLILVDIAVAQELTGRWGRLDRIDLILPESGAQAILDQIASLLPPDAVLLPAAARSGAVEQMTAAFRVNLTALSLLALVVGLFLIYNTITFSVVQRRPLFGTLRCLGVTRREVFVLVASEALLVGVVGAIFGTALGVLMGQGAVQLVTQAINDLFFVVTVRGVQIPIMSLVKGSVLGVVATLLAAMPPAWEAASVPPRAALSRSGLESKAQRAVSVSAWVGALLVLAGSLVLLLPTPSLVISFGGAFLVVVGFAMLTPLTTRLAMRLAAPLLGRVGGVLGRMAPRNVVGALSRTSIAVMALMVAISVAIGVSVMVNSFRATVVAWLEQTLQGDIYISAPSLTAVTPSTRLNPQVLETVRAWPGVERAYVLRATSADSPDGLVQIAATDNFAVGGERAFLWTDFPPAQIWEQLEGGAVIVSEPFANRLKLPRRGAQVTLYTASGPQTFPVVGVYYDYASTQGTVLMALPLYQRLWQDQEITAIALRLEEGVSVDAVAVALQSALAPLQRLVIRPNQVLRQEVLVVFDRTFAITSALQLLATIVAFIGILSALLSLELERQRELGVLRALGMTVRQMWTLILIETGLMGAVAGLLAMPTGYALSLILVYIINRRSFGWTLQMSLEPEPFIQALLVAISAALLAALYPAWRMGRMVASEALRSE